MATQRIKGQEVNLLLVRDGNPSPIGRAQSATVTLDIERLEDEYIGETSMVYDAIFNGIQIEADFHIENSAILDFADAVKLRAERRIGAVLRVDSALTLAFPNGTVTSITLIDLEFAEFPIEVGSRKDYVSVKLDGKTAQYKII